MTHLNRQIQKFGTGALTLDVALGGGLPKGRAIEIFGPESAGKTTVALHAIAQIQKTGGIAAFIDAEHALDPAYAVKIGVDIDRLLVSQPDTGEMALEISDRLVRSAAVDLVVIDSVAALVPKAEIAGAMGETASSLQAKLMSYWLRKITHNMGRSDCAVIFLNQLRHSFYSIAGPETTAGGDSLKFYASVRIDLRPMQVLSNKLEDYGMRVQAKVVKNKVAPPFEVGEFDLIFGQGISHLGCVFDLGEQLRLITRKRSGYRYQGKAIGQSREECLSYLERDLKLYERLERTVLKVLKLRADS